MNVSVFKKHFLMKVTTIVVSSFFLFLAFFSTSQANEVQKQPELVFGIVPQQSATRLAKIWVPFLKHLSAETNVRIKFATAKDIPTFEACLSQGAYDIAYMNPYHFTTYHALKGYRAFARQEKKRLRGLIVVKKGSSFGDLKDLDNKDIAFPSPAAFGASVIPRAEMKRNKMSITPKYVKSHDSVYRSVAAGLFPAGGGVLRTYRSIPEGLRSQLRVLYKTDAYTPHAFAAHPRIKQDLIQQISDVMVGLKDKQSNLLKPLGMKGFESAIDKDWDDVRALNLTDSHTKIIKDSNLRCRSG